MSPSRQTRRASARWWRKLFRRAGVEAGGGGRRWQNVAQLHNPARAMDAARASARARAAAAAINSPQGARIAEQWVSALAGKGWQARSRHPDRDTASRLNAAFEAMANPVLPLLVRSVVVHGEAFALLTVGSGIHLRPLILSTAQVDASLSRPLDNGGRIEQGIELDASGEVVAYHVLHEPPGTGFAPYETRRITASDMLHVFLQLEPGQLRGLSWLAPVLLKLSDRDQLADALLMQAKTAAMLTGYIRDPEGGAAGFGETGDASGAIDVSLEPGAMRILPPGAEVTFSSPPQGLSQAVDYLAAIDREIAAGTGLPYEALTGDLGRANYSSARVGLLDFRRRAEALQRHLIEAQFLRPLWRRWIEVSQLAGELPADDPDLFEVRFIGPGFQWVDPEKEVAAEIAAIEAGLKSREEVVAARGRDIDELDEEIARDRRRTPQEVTQ